MRFARVMVEILHVLAGLAAAACIGGFASWAYPIGRDNIWLVTYGAMVAVVAMGVKPVLNAARGLPGDD